jgi:hypothetical protein
MIQADVYSILSNNEEVTKIASSRIYPSRLPQSVIVPAVVYTINNIDPVKSLTGESGLDYGLVRIVCWAKDYTVAHLLMVAVRSAFVESGISILTSSIQDIMDEETHNYGVIINMTAWSLSTVGLTPQNISNPIAYLAQANFTGDGVTKEFPLPKFRAGSLLVFFNGRLAKKGEESDVAAAYWEKSTLNGFIFRVAPRGGDYIDEILAFYAKS